MIMNKLKMNLALIALAFPLLLCAKTQRIEMDIWHRKHRTPTELFVQIEAFFDDCNKELTIEFAQDWEAVTIEIKSKEGYVVYRNLYILKKLIKKNWSGVYRGFYILHILLLI